MESAIQILLKWASDNGVQLHPYLRIQPNDTDPTGVAVISEIQIATNEIVTSIPKSAVLSVKSCTLANRIPAAPYGLGAQLALSLALSNELVQGAASRWHGYLQSLPPSTVPIALLWGDNDAFPSDPDGDEARAWLIGTEVEKALRGQENENLLDEIRRYYYSFAERLLPKSCTISRFLYAYSLVSSRAFMVDAYHGLSMVPIADAFNHVTENHVHLECDYDVCPLCGSFAECTHDREDAPPSSSGPVDWHSPSVLSVPDTCDMLANRHIPPLSEVFNTYGARRSNASLLAWYGFALDGNENDVVGWDFAELVQALSDEPSTVQLSEQLYTTVMQVWSSSLGSLAADDSKMVYRPGLDNGEERTLTGSATMLCINSDAQMSVYLWGYLAVCAAMDMPGSQQMNVIGSEGGVEEVEQLVALLSSLLDEQVRLEKMIEDKIGDGTVHSANVAEALVPSSKSAASRVILRVADFAIRLCQHKIAGMGKCPDVSTAKLGEMLDDVPENNQKTRLALAQVLSERSMLEGCLADWQEVHDILCER